MTTPTLDLTMAVPDLEYNEIYRRCKELHHKSSITLLSKDKEPIRFYLTRNGDMKAIRVSGGKEFKMKVKALSQAIPDENNMLRDEIKKQHPEYNNARLDFEVDYIKEMRKSVMNIVNATGCKPEEAVKILEIGLAQKELEDMTKYKEEQSKQTLG
jgi:hypothetical protein